MPAEKKFRKKSALPAEASANERGRLASMGARLHLDTEALAKSAEAPHSECEALQETCERLRQCCE